jgi:opacity protein-like surface antigen
MKKFVVTAALIVAFVTPALAADYYVALRLGGGGGCTIMTHSPSPTKYKMMGHYTSRSEAKKVMGTMTECK